MTKSKKYFKIELQSMEWQVAKDTALLAAYVNSGKESVNIEGLGFYARTGCLNHTPGTFTITVSGSTLTIDKGIENLLVIEEREELVLWGEKADENDGKFAVSNSI